MNTYRVELSDGSTALNVEADEVSIFSNMIVFQNRDEINDRYVTIDAICQTEVFRVRKICPEPDMLLKDCINTNQHAASADVALDAAEQRAREFFKQKLYADAACCADTAAPNDRRTAYLLISHLDGTVISASSYPTEAEIWKCDPSLSSVIERYYDFTPAKID